MKVAQIHNDESILPRPDWAMPMLTEAGIEFDGEECETADQVMSLAGDADVIWVMGGSRVLTTELLERLDKCWAILRTGAGTDNIPILDATRLGIIVGNTPEATTQQVAEHAAALLLNSVRQISAYDRFLRRGVWDRHAAPPRRHLYGQTLGFVGFGRIAQATAKKLSGFELNCIAYDPVITAETMKQVGVEAVSFDDVFRRSDYVSVHTPLIDETFHLIGEREFQLMKPTAVFINTSRGKVVDEPALIRAIDEDWIAGAGLDVFEEEPVSHDNPLLRSEKVVVTPHIAGESDESVHLFWKHSCETLIEMSKDRWPLWYVNPDVKPRRSLTNGPR
jgi:D-3-phosphoglycerate dehydrogenase